ncbi:MAG: CRISPR-associated helicase Cas3' [Oceanobacter sp.]
MSDSNTVWYAHSATGLSETQWQTLKSHLKDVGELAASKASHFNGQDLARIAGLLHDLGKYTEEFQQRLRGSKTKVDHSTHGALEAIKYCENPVLGLLLAYCIAGHHAGLADRRETQNKRRITDLDTRLKAELPQLQDDWQKEIQLSSQPNLAMQPRASAEEIAFQFSVLGRMIYSSLVDADFLDTDAFYRKIENRPQRNTQYPTLGELKTRLDVYLNQPGFQSDQGINGIRKNILNTVKQRAELEPGLFSLNVPTGGGKTLSSLAFALDHAIRHGQRRVILVIPFTSIVEQNAQVWRDALGLDDDNATLLEHHSAFNADSIQSDKPSSKDKLREAAENWEPPIVVTTAVQFFESLFAHRSSRCRKLHNIANSVVILDEAQTLPTKLLRPCVAMIKELALNYRTSLVMCTATQPALEQEDGFENGLGNVRELAPDPILLHKSLERVVVEYIGERDDDQLVEELLQQQQVLCIVNNRRHARALYDRIQEAEGAAHLTTLMCAKHRSSKLADIRQWLDDGKPVRLISTSLIEAGVDISLKTVYRAEAGLDSIAQAAGRCNRNKEWPIEESRVRVFKPDAEWAIPPEVEQFASAFKTVYRTHADNLLSMAAIQDYFKQVYWLKGKALDAKSILDCAFVDLNDPTSLDIGYDQMAQRFQMIESNMQPVIVPYGDNSNGSPGKVEQLLEDLEYREYAGGIARQLQGYLVQVPEQALKALRQYGAVRAIQPERFGDQFLVLNKSFNLYDNECGLSWDDPAYLAAEVTVL